MAAIKQRADKVDRHRQRMRAAGFRPVQFWVPDTRAADFAESVRQQCLELTGDPAELEVLQFTEEAAGPTGRASWRDRVCQYVVIQEVAVSVINKYCTATISGAGKSRKES